MYSASLRGGGGAAHFLHNHQYNHKMPPFMYIQANLGQGNSVGRYESGVHLSAVKVGERLILGRGLYFSIPHEN